MSVPILCIALLGLLVVGGGFYVSLCRSKGRVIHGYPSDPDDPLHRAVRAHGNATEYVPVMALVIYIIAQLNPPAWVVGVIIAFTVARYLNFIGLAGASLAKPNPARFLGSLFTYILGLVLLGFLAMRAMF